LRPPYQDDVEHYRKMLAGHVKVDLVEVREDEKVPPRIPNRAVTVLLTSGGRAFDSEQFSDWLEERRRDGRDVCFVIGGPKGLELEADLRLSLGPMTLPHQLARVVLLEQIYRAHKILAREPYHY
jgi:23S rRNA (pseudouridine1915-N3)-methyltransferase